MTFTLFGIDFYLQDKIFGFYLCTLKDGDWHSKSLFTIYYSDSTLFLDLFWIRILTRYF